MDSQDWKSVLGAAFDVPVPTAEEIQAEKEAASHAPAGDALQQQGKAAVHVLIDRKNRKGKTVTLVTDLKCDDEALKELARELKQHCGVGGSARGGEILLQGDFRTQVSDLLRDKGFKVKG
ncbi:MAG: translation initiation factor [Muribaculaceae bacterium]|nr:translation initiation factor [Muribaculaceae bacterium]